MSIEFNDYVMSQLYGLAEANGYDLHSDPNYTPRTVRGYKLCPQDISRADRRAVPWVPLSELLPQLLSWGTVYTDAYHKNTLAIH